ncbi:MAG: energy transducer TonB, partial [Flavobacteriaceae bacterium]
PEVIEVVEDEEEVEETVIESTETNEDEIVEVVEVIEEEFEDVDVPFAVIEDVPIFPGCEKVAKSERRNCFQEQMNKHIRKNFRYPEIAQEMGIQGRVYVNFIIAKDGSISNIRMRGPDKNLEAEAQRIISKLPQMTPGKQRGRAVRVPFSIPITFRLQ